jgi:hypothetical protein
MLASHLTREQLEAGLPHVRNAPRDLGTVELVVRRPAEDPDMQLNVMSARVVDLVAGGDRDRWALAGDQLYLDLDLSEEHLPVGTRLAVGAAVIEVTPPPHTGCAKFMQRFGVDAHKFVNAKEHRPLRLRGLCAKVVEPGPVRPGDAVRKL